MKRFSEGVQARSGGNFFVDSFVRDASECESILRKVRTPPPPPPPGEALTPDQLNDLVAPIALYPDPLLSQVLVASTYPLEVVQAYQWLPEKPWHQRPRAHSGRRSRKTGTRVFRLWFFCPMSLSG